MSQNAESVAIIGGGSAIRTDSNGHRNWDSSFRRLLGTPAPVQVNEVGPSLRGEIFRFDRSSQRDGRPDLLQVGGTVGTRSEMSLESSTIATRERTFEVIGDEFDCLLTDDISASEHQHQSVPLHLGVEESSQAAPSPVKQDPLVPRTDPEYRTRLFA